MPIVITPEPKRLRAQLNPVSFLAALWLQRVLTARLIRREIEGRYRGRWLGLLWTGIHPLVLLVVYTFVFGVVFRARWPQTPTGTVTEYGMTVFCGLIAFNFLAECLGRAPGVVLEVPSYVKRVVFPLEILPVSLVGCAAFHALVSLAVLAAATVLTGRPSWPTILLLPIVATPLIFLGLGLTWLLASLGVFIRDLGQVIGLALQVALFGTPIFYALETVPDWLQPIMRSNPLTSIVENFRRVILWGAPPDWLELLAWTVVSGAIMLLGYAWFTTTKLAFADVM